MVPDGERVRDSSMDVPQLNINEPSLRKTVWKARIEDEVPSYLINWR
jgi:hypothetical protein